jgi:predicted RNA binding protein YcfA (HicA-like mRNA interferase family)
MKSISGKEFARLLQRRGWRLVRVKGSHHLFKHPDFREHIALPIHGNDDLKIGALKALMKVAKIEEHEL